MVEHGAGRGSSLADEAYVTAGATLASAAEVWRQAEMILKVKEPLAAEYPYLRPGLILFTYLHLAADEVLTRALLAHGVRAIGYETIQLDDGSLPLLAPMSEVAGRLAIQVGSWCLQATTGGRGVLLSGVAGVRPGKVVILGAGIAGASACQAAVGLGARVSILDVNPTRLRYVHDILTGHVTTVIEPRHREEVPNADLVVGTVLIPGAKARSCSREPSSAACGRARRSSTSRSTRAGEPRPRVRPRTTTRSTSRRAWSTTASPTCRARCPTPRRTR
jgi:alanine dehydrogenase